MKTLRPLHSVVSKAWSKQNKYSSPFQRYHQFNLVFLAAALIPMFSIGLFNTVIDPYGVINTPVIRGFNDSKPDKWKHQRLFKAIDIIRVKPVTVLLGSSRTNQGLDPNYTALSSNQSAYNIGLNGANLYETRRYLEHAIANQEKLKLVIIGLDSVMFNSSLGNQLGFEENRLSKRYITPQDLVKYVFSFDTFYGSKKSLITSINHSYSDIYYPNGFFVIQSSKTQNSIAEFKKSLGTYFIKNDKFIISSEYMNELKYIVNICQQHNIKLIAFISPSHAAQWEAIHATGYWSTFEQWKREIVKVTPVWDFSGYNSITTEPIREHMKNYTDDSHYRREVGNLVLNRILSYQEETVPKDFGILITPDNIESHLAKIRSDREVWASRNPDVVKLVEHKKLESENKRRQLEQ